ncbi:MAG: hypothetical protein WBD00_02305 [Candidatus Omnitrophota bacterium]
MAKKKTDLSKLMKQYEPVVKKAGEQISKAIKAAEKDVARMYRVAETHVEIQMKNIQKEKLYYDIGKEVACKIMKGGISEEDIEKFRKKINKIDSESAKKKKQLSRVGKTAKKKTAKKK